VDQKIKIDPFLFDRDGDGRSILADLVGIHTASNAVLYSGGHNLHLLRVVRMAGGEDVRRSLSHPRDTGLPLRFRFTARFENAWGEEEKFEFSSTLIFVQSLIGAILAKSVILLFRLPGNTAPPATFIPVTFSVMMAQFCSFQALLYIPYPIQVLAKSCKPIPVMVMGMIVLKRSYPARKYALVFLMCLGIALFAFSSNSINTSSPTMGWAFWGYALLVISLSFDGVSGPLLERIVQQYTPTSNQVMFITNMWSALFLFLAILLKGELFVSMAFCRRHPEILLDLVWLGCTSGVGQHAIIFIIRNFNSLVLSIVTTTRKLFTILISILWFGHSLSWIQWLAMGLVFSSITWDVIQSQSQYITSPLIPQRLPRKSSTAHKSFTTLHMV